MTLAAVTSLGELAQLAADASFQRYLVALYARLDAADFAPQRCQPLRELFVRACELAEGDADALVAHFGRERAAALACACAALANLAPALGDDALAAHVAWAASSLDSPLLRTLVKH